MVHGRQMRLNGWRKGSAMFVLQLLMNSRFRILQPFFIGVQPSLIGVFKRSGERRHDLPTVSQISPNFSPFFILADSFESSSNFHGLFEFIQIKRALVNTRETVEMGAILFVKLGELV